jgi:spermidine/putrescine transport system ATP-binding protein
MCSGIAVPSCTDRLRAPSLIRQPCVSIPLKGESRPIDDGRPTHPTSGHIVLSGVSKSFDQNRVVDGLDLTIGQGEFFTMLGPSGCGKTTTLRMIAGFEEPSEGRIYLEGTDVTEVPAARRNVNMVFQAYALFPHMTVEQNISFGLAIKKVPRGELIERVRDAIKSVRLEGLEKRRPAKLSGGQQQRVALARALVNRPAALLLDEPLGALDLKLRKELQLELKHTQVATGTTFVYVTHDQEEALTISDRIAVMNGGVIEQVATPRELYERPATAFVADFIGVSNLIHFRTDEREDGVLRMRIGAGEHIVAREEAGAQAATELLVTVRPEKIKLDPLPGVCSHVTATVVDVLYLGSMTQIVVELPIGDRLTVHRLNDEVDAHTLAPGQRVGLHWAAEHSFVIGGGHAGH